MIRNEANTAWEAYTDEIDYLEELLVRAEAGLGLNVGNFMTRVKK